MSDRKIELFKREEIFNEFEAGKGMSATINAQLFTLSIIGFFCNLVTFLIWIQDYFPEDKGGAYSWYVLRPFIVQAVLVGIMAGVRHYFDYVKKRMSFVNQMMSRIVGSFLYSVFFGIMIYYYKEFPIFWLFAVCPMLVTSFYRDIKWFLSTLVWTAVGMNLIIMDLFEKSTYRIYDAPKIMMVTEGCVIAVLIGFITVAIHYRNEHAIEHAAKAEAMQEAKSAFFAKMSHEIRTPITAVLGMDEMILREDVSPEVESYALNIRNSGNALLSIINDILDSSKLDAGKLDLVPTDYDLLSVINDCYNMLNLRAKDKGLELRVKNNPNIPKTLYGDGIRIRQVVTNILSNAVKYTKVGHVDFIIDYAQTGEKKIDLVIKVADTGIGISEDDMGRLFESFERLDAQKNRYVEGTGLGLSITKQLVEMMEGTISVESAIDEGSVFTVVIPQGIVNEIPVGDYNSVLIQNLPSKERYKEKFTAPDAKVLVVDDVKVNIEVFKGLLKKTLIQIDSAQSGEIALDLVQKKKYDMIFLDHLMPEMDGVETLRRMQEMDHLNKSTPVVALTANAGTDAEAEYKALGFTDYVSKPIKGKLLEELIYRYLFK